MAVRLLILGTEARHHYVRPEIPDDPHDVSKNFVVIPEAHCLFSRFRKPEIGCSREELLCMIDASRIEQFLSSNNAEALVQSRTAQVLPPAPARIRKASGLV